MNQAIILESDRSDNQFILISKSDDHSSFLKFKSIQRDQSENWLSKLIDTLNNKWNEFPLLEDLSNEVGVHPITISKCFPKKYGITISEYMRLIKVKRAIELIQTTSFSLAKIAYFCGFSDQSHMSRLIKKHVGKTPATIRNTTTLDHNLLKLVVNSVVPKNHFKSIFKGFDHQVSQETNIQITQQW